MKFGIALVKMDKRINKSWNEQTDNQKNLTTSLFGVFFIILAIKMAIKFNILHFPSPDWYMCPFMLAVWFFLPIGICMFALGVTKFLEDKWEGWEREVRRI